MPNELQDFKKQQISTMSEIFYCAVEVIEEFFEHIVRQIYRVESNKNFPLTNHHPFEIQDERAIQPPEWYQKDAFLLGYF